MMHLSVRLWLHLNCQQYCFTYDLSLHIYFSFTITGNIVMVHPLVMASRNRCLYSCHLLRGRCAATTDRRMGDTAVRRGSDGRGCSRERSQFGTVEENGEGVAGLDAEEPVDLVQIGNVGGSGPWVGIGCCTFHDAIDW